MQTFAQGAAGEAVGLIGSSGYLEISVNKGNAARSARRGPRRRSNRRNLVATVQ